MADSFVRVWQKLSIVEVRKHLLLIDDLYGSCANCKQIGLNFLKDYKCPQCGVVFRYLATRLKNPAESTKILSRIETEGLPFILIDRDDYDRAQAGDQFGGLFSKTSKPNPQDAPEVSPTAEIEPDPDPTA